MLYNHYCSRVPKPSSSPHKAAPHPLSSPSPVLLLSASATTNLLSVDLPTLDPSCKCSYKTADTRVWLLSLSRMFSGFSEVVHVSGLHSSSRLIRIPLTICKIPHFVYQFVDRHLDCFHFLAIVNYEHVCIHFYLNTCSQFFWVSTRSGILGLTRGGTARLFPTVAGLF